MTIFTIVPSGTKNVNSHKVPWNTYLSRKLSYAVLPIRVAYLTRDTLNSTIDSLRYVVFHYVVTPTV